MRRICVVFSVLFKNDRTNLQSTPIFFRVLKKLFITICCENAVSSLLKKSEKDGLDIFAPIYLNTIIHLL